MTTHAALLGAALMFATVRASAGDEPDRTKRPAPQPSPQVMLPDIQKAVLPNGLNVWLVEHHELPTVALNLVVQAGSDHDPASAPGLALMTADLMDEGTSTRSSLEIADAMESLGAQFNTSAGIDASSVTLSTLTSHLDKALEVFADVLVNPVFPAKEFERIRKQRLTGLLQQRDQPVTIANNAYAAILYGASHPYGNNPTGTEASLKAMTADDLKKFYTSYYRPNNATLIVVGDVKLDQITGILGKALAGWKAGDVPAFALPPVKEAGQRRIYLIDKPGAPQSEFRIGYPALARSTPDFFPVTVMNRMLGGQFTSRINLNLRERHGFTYGARSAFNFQKGPGPFTASGAITTEKSDSALHEFLAEIDLMSEKGMTAEELAYVKKGMLGSFALSFETPAQIAGALQNIVLYGLPENYYRTYLQNIDAVSLGDVARCAKTYLESSKMAVVIVGDLAKIKSGIVAAKAGDVVVCDLDGKPLP